MIAYVVPAMSVGGVAKFAEKYPPAPLEKPGIVVDARIVLVGRPPLVTRMSSVTGGFAPEQPAQNMLMSIRGTVPVTAGWNVWPIHCVSVTLKPLFPSEVFVWSMRGRFARMTLSGAVVASTFVSVPRWKSELVVSLKHALPAAPLNEKSSVVVPPSLMTTFDAEPGLRPGNVATTGPRYVPAGTPRNA